MKIYYIGSFPPPYGGVTIKNKILFQNISKYIDIDKIELGLIKNRNIIEVVRLFLALVNPLSTFIIGSASKSRKLFTIILYYFNRKALNNSILIVMGGVSSRIIANNRHYLKWVREYKQIYVETAGMKLELTDQGLTNVSVFPNCREKPKSKLNINNQERGKIKLLYFSLISEEKGVDIVLDSLEKLKSANVNFSVDFFGHIEENYELEFKNRIKPLDEVYYRGVFSSDIESVYKKLNEYDLLLLPTKAKTEGIPGILVEAKIAGLPAIVSDINYNSEIINDGKNGFVLRENTSLELASTIKRLYMDRVLLGKMKEDAEFSSRDYLIESYIENIVNMFR